MAEDWALNPQCSLLTQSCDLLSFLPCPCHLTSLKSLPSWINPNPHPKASWVATTTS